MQLHPPEIRLHDARDWPAIWAILEPVFRAAKTYAVSPGITEAAARSLWLETPAATFVAGRGGKILGSYYLKPNQSGPGDHVCNCGYVVSPEARGQGIASQLCGHSQHEAVSRGFLAMQFNLVVSTNDAAVRLWQKHGFQTVGTLPAAFRDPDLGLVDAYVMHKFLTDDSGGPALGNF